MAPPPDVRPVGDLPDAIGILGEALAAKGLDVSGA